MGASPRKDYVGSTSVLRILLVTAIAGNTVTINGLTYTGVAGVKSDNTEFSIDTSDTAAATDLADSINNDVRSGTVTAILTATSSAGVVVVSSTAVVGAETNSESTIQLSGNQTTLLSLASNVAKNNQALKRVNFVNTPFSVEATGADKQKRVLVVDTEAAFNTISTRDRVLWGNRHGYIKAHSASTSLTFTWLDKTNTEVDTVKTMAEVIASGSLVVLTDLY